MLALKKWKIFVEQISHKSLNLEKSKRMSGAIGAIELIKIETKSHKKRKISEKAMCERNAIIHLLLFLLRLTLGCLRFKKQNISFKN